MRGCGMKLRRLGGLDGVFLAAETPASHMHMMAVMVLDPSTVPGGYSFQKFRDFIASRLPLVAPLRRRLIEVPFGIARPFWIEEDEIDLDLHLQRLAVPAPGGPRELAEMAAEMNGRQLDHARPLWQMTVVEGLENGSIAILAKLHHALMDGMAGMQFMASMVSSEPSLSDPPASLPSEPQRIPGPLELLLGAVPSVAARPLRFAKLGGSALHRALLAWLGGQDEQEAMPDPPAVGRMLFNARMTPGRTAAYTSLPLADVKAVASAFGATLNDVVLAVVGGALRRYLEREGQPLDEPLVAAVPVSTHDAEGDDLTNSYSVMFTQLATDLADPIERLEAIRRCSEREKQREHPFWGNALAELLEIPSPALFSLLARAYTGLGLIDRVDPFCNLVVSNVPGPPHSLYFGGARIQGIYPLGPIFDGVGVNITVISVGESLDIGISACRDLVPDLWRIATDLSGALGELVERMNKLDPIPASAR